MRRPPSSTPFPYTTLFRSGGEEVGAPGAEVGLLGQLAGGAEAIEHGALVGRRFEKAGVEIEEPAIGGVIGAEPPVGARSEEHTSELQSRQYLVCRLLLEKK